MTKDEMIEMIAYQSKRLYIADGLNDELIKALDTALTEWQAWMKSVEDGDYSEPDADDWEQFEKTANILTQVKEGFDE